MKSLTLVAFLLIVSSCQFTKQQKGEKLIEAYLSETLNDPHSYESIDFSKIETICYAYEDTISAGIEMKNKETEYTRQHKYSQAKQIRKTLDSIDFIYPNPVIKSYVITHRYRAKNNFGGLTISNQTFVLNPTLDSVIFVHDSN